MSESKLPFEESWRETWRQYAPQPEAGDWAGMEELLRQPADQARQRIIENPLATAKTQTSVSSRWILLALLAAALFYLLTQASRGEPTPPNVSPRTEVIIPAITDESTFTTPVSTPPAYNYDTLYRMDDQGNLTQEIAQIDSVAITKPSPTIEEISLPSPATITPDSLLTLPPLGKKINPLPFSPLRLPTDAELLERRMDALRHSGRLKIKIPPNNGYFPRYPDRF